MTLQYNGDAIKIDSFFAYTKGLTDLSCITLDFAAGQPSTWGLKFDLMFTNDKGIITKGMNIFTNKEKHCGNVHNQKYNSLSVNFQRYHTPSQLIEKDTEKFIREPTPADHSQLYLVTEAIHARVRFLLEDAIRGGSICIGGKPVADKDPLLHIDHFKLCDTPMGITRKEPNGKVVKLINPIMRLSLKSHKPPLIFDQRSFKDKSTDDIEKEPCLTTENVGRLIVKRTLMNINVRYASITNTDKGFRLGIYANGMGITRPDIGIGTSYDSECEDAGECEY